MKTVPTSKQQSNPNVLRTTPADATLPIYELSVPFFDKGTPEEWIKFRCRLQAAIKGQNVTQGSPSYAVAKTLLKGNALMIFKQADIAHRNQTVTNFVLCLDDMAKHVFLSKAGQTQKSYMQRNIRYGGGITMKEWQLDADTVLDIIEYAVSASWYREFTVQGFDPVDQGLQKFVDFCTCLELCEPSEGELKGKKPSNPKTTGKHKAKVLTTPTSPAGERKIYCKMHGQKKTHNTEDCFELKQRAKRAKSSTNCDEADRMTYKDLNAFVNAKVTAALNKAKNSKKREEKEVKIDAFDKFHSLYVESSNEKGELNEHAPSAAENTDRSASCLLSDSSDSNVK
eukprot:12117421-Ditylum_brightwellii.AAC.2